MANHRLDILRLSLWKEFEFYARVSSNVASLSGDFSTRLAIVPAVIEPETFSAVRAMSINGSIEISSAAMVTGKPIAGRTIKAANVAPPPTPAIPNELMVIIAINDRIKCRSSGLIPLLELPSLQALQDRYPHSRFGR